MSKSDKMNLGLVPKLRFPEFGAMSGWATVSLEDHVSKLGDGIHSTPEYDENGDYFFINGNNLNQTKIVLDSNTKRVNKATYEKYKKDLNTNTVLISINGTLGNTSFYNNEPIILGKSACYFNVSSTLNKFYIIYYLTTDTFLNYVHVTATGSTIKNLSLKAMRELQIPLPYLKEQEKIADCLSSLDDIISLEDKKHTSLKEHKKGLMQKLFPADGKTVPELRFKEFQNSPNWETKKLGDIGEFQKGIGLSKEELNKINGDIKAIPYTSIYTDFNETFTYNNIKHYTNTKNTKIIDKSSLLFASSSNMKENIGKVTAYLDIIPIAIGGDIIIFNSNSCHLVYLSYLLNSTLYRKKIRNISQGATIIHLYSSMLKSLILHLPSTAEQEKIAECLSSLDDLISAQAEKIGALKIHKKYLMQNLFPAISEVN